MSRLTIDTSDFKRLEKLLLKAPAKIKAQADAEAQASADDIWRYATKLVPVYKGALRAGMYNEKIAEATYKIGNNVDYAPYVEFGTGIKVFISPEWADFASQFKGKTGIKWDDALDEIKQWCRLKGIPEESAYPILVTILKDGIEANPFLYPAFNYGRKQFYEKIKQLTKNFNLDG